MRELGPAIMALGGFGEHLDDQHGIQQCVDGGIFEARFAADGHDIRVGVHTRFADLDAHVIGVDLAGFASELLVQAGGYIQA